MHAAAHGTPCSFGGFLNQQQIGAAYALADVLALPSNGEETWGLVVNEAMACGVPAILSYGVGCPPDLIMEGKTGFAFRHGNLEELTDRMERLVQHRTLRCEMSRQVQIRIDRFLLDASGVTLKTANGGQGKTGQRKWPGTKLFYPVASCGGKSVFVRQLRGPHLSTCP